MVSMIIYAIAIRIVGLLVYTRKSTKLEINNNDSKSKETEKREEQHLPDDICEKIDELFAVMPT